MSEIVTVAAITMICYLVGLGVKSYGKADKWIPVIVGTVGGILGAVGMVVMQDFPASDILNAIAVGIASGLASVGINQVYKQLKGGE